MRTQVKRSNEASPLDADWISEARRMLIEGGVSAVEINPLAARLGVTRGGFYWRFKNRQDLLNRLLDEWEASNNAAYLRAVCPPGTPTERLRRLADLILEERFFDPALDTAVREWGRVDAAVNKLVRNADAKRLKALTQLFLEAGNKPDEAMVRARILYFHQIGYYALGMVEPKAERRRLYPIYESIIAGLDD
jgi:AcrR family transcriptional regulator